MYSKRAVERVLVKIDEVVTRDVTVLYLLSYGAAFHETCAGGTRTHNTRISNHVLRIGSRSYFFWWRRSSGQRLARQMSPPRVSIAKVGAMRIELKCTPNRQSPLYSMPNEGLPRDATKQYGRPCQRHESLIVDRPVNLREITGPFTSRSPDIATLGPSCTPSWQLGSVVYVLKDPTKWSSRHRAFRHTLQGC